METNQQQDRAPSDVLAERERLLVQVRDANEKLVVATVHALELADEANAARVLAEHNEERFRSLVATSSAIVWQASAEGRVRVDRDHWRELTGTEAGTGEADEWGWLEAVHPGDQDRVREAWTAAVATASPYECQHRLRRREGGYAWVVARAVPIPESGPVREWMGMLTDVSDRVRVEVARERFIGILGHDLNNPLAAILMGAQVLEDLSGPYARAAKTIASSAHRMEAMIHDLLDFARGRLGGGIPITPTACDLRLLCDQVVEEMAQAYPTRVMEFAGIGDLRGEWDPDRVEQVLSNLIGNAVKHGRGPILVMGHAEGDDVVTTIHNQGPAIPAEAIPTLFEPFTTAQVGDGKQASHKGLGLGLYIVSEIVHAHGGTISVSSVEGQGTTFTIRWPRRAGGTAHQGAGL
jgi:sigma-B regulation protein RsbU (phosphoserine phosphatase)